MVVLAPIPHHGLAPLSIVRAAHTVRDDVVNLCHALADQGKACLLSVRKYKNVVFCPGKRTLKSLLLIPIVRSEPPKTTWMSPGISMLIAEMLVSMPDL